MRDSSPRWSPDFAKNCMLGEWAPGAGAKTRANASFEARSLDSPLANIRSIDSRVDADTGLSASADSVASFTAAAINS